MSCRREANDLRIFPAITIVVEWDPANGQWQATYSVSDATARTLPAGRGHFGKTGLHLNRYLQTRIQKILGEYLFQP